MWSDYISRQFLAVPETAGPLIILNSKYVYFSLRRLTSSFINIYLYFFLRGCFLAFSTVVLVWIVSLSPSSALFPAQASDLHIQMLAGFCCCLVTQLCLTLCDPIDCSTPGFPDLHHLLEFAQTHVRWLDDVIQPSHLLLPSSSALSLSQQQGLFQSRLFFSELALCIRWPKYWSFSVIPSNEFSVLISFRIDWFDLHAVQGTLKSLLHHHSSKALILRHSAFFMVQLSHLYMTTGKTTVYRPLLAK